MFDTPSLNNKTGDDFSIEEYRSTGYNIQQLYPGTAVFVLGSTRANFIVIKDDDPK